MLRQHRSTLESIFKFRNTTAEEELERIEWQISACALNNIAAEIAILGVINQAWELKMATINGTPSDDSLYGTAGDDTINAFEGKDFVYAGSGADHIYGGDGDDWMTGEDGDDEIYGGSGTDHLMGGNGDDYLNGGADSDFLEAGSGTDIIDGGDTATRNILSYRNSAAGVGVVLNIATGEASGGDATNDIFTNIQSLDGSQYNDSLTGDGDTNVLYGEGGDDLLMGGDGYDYLYGQDGDDILMGGAGGEFLGDTLEGGDGNDRLFGGSGPDVLDGGNGSDAAYYSDSTVGVTVSLASGIGTGGTAQGDSLINIESLSGSNFNDFLAGNSLVNVLRGNAGNDLLLGNGGLDVIGGDAGADTFLYGATTDSTVGANADRILDFSHAQGDKIDLHLIDANTTVGGDQAFTFIVGAFTGVAGQLHAVVSGTDTLVDGDVNGDGVADFQIKLSGAPAMVAGDFIL